MAVTVSVVIPTFNRAQYIVRTITSVTNQSFSDFELIIVDDGSTDSTEELVNELSLNDPRIKYIKSTNMGVSHARNLGVDNSSGQLIAFLDSDDEWIANKLKLQVHFMRENPEYFWCHGNEIWKRNGQVKKQHTKHKKSGGDQFARSLELCCISPSTVMISKDILASHKWFKEDFIVCEDYDLWLRLSCRNKIGFIEEELTIKHGGHDDQLSMRYHSMDYYRAKAIFELLNDDLLDPQQIILASKKLHEKCEILIAGFEKHNSTEYEKIREVKTWREFAKTGLK